MRSFTAPLLRAALALAVLGATETAALAQDPGIPGPHAVATDFYTQGDEAFVAQGFPGPLELTGSVTYPTDLGGGPYPLVMLLHGRHVTCYKGATAGLLWPCPGDSKPIESYKGYDYLARHLASWGFVVVSVSANGINARDNSVYDLGMSARAQLMQAHLNLWEQWVDVGGEPFGDRFLGAVDLDTIGTMGHSRGGEGVVRHYVYNQSLGAPYGIKAVLPLAPVDFSRPVVNNAALDVVLPYCDGDVSNLQGVHYFDDARYNVPGDLAPKHTTLVMGANHNYFNTVWTPGMGPPGAVDDWAAYVNPGDPYCGNGPGNQRLSPERQRAVGLAYMTAFFRAYLKGESSMVPYLTGDAPAPASTAPAEVHVSYHAPDAPDMRRDVNRFLTPANLTTDTLGGPVTIAAFTPGDLCGGDAPEPAQCLPNKPTSSQPHTTPSARAPDKRGLSQLRGGWTSPTGSVKNVLPAGTGDVSNFDSLQFRAAVNFADARNPPGKPQDFRVVLTDGAGATASVKVADVSSALYYPPGVSIPKVILNTVRIPLTAFGGDIDFTSIQSVELSFTETPSGAILVSDLAFASSP